MDDAKLVIACIIVGSISGLTIGVCLAHAYDYWRNVLNAPMFKREEKDNDHDQD